MPSLFCRSSQASADADRGVIIVLMALIVAVLLMVAGLAFDAGNLYRARLALQNAVDATALAAVTHITLKGQLQVEAQAGGAGLGANLTDLNTKSGMMKDWVNANLNPELLVKANMAAAGYPDDAFHPIVAGGTYHGRRLLDENSAISTPPLYQTDPAVFDYEVTAERPVHFLLLHAIPSITTGETKAGAGTNRFLNIHAQGKSRRRALNVSLILDVSESMSCPTAGSCNCLYGAAPRPPCPGPGGRRFDGLADALEGFLQMINIDRDRVHIVPFNIEAVATTALELKSNHGMAGQVTTAATLTAIRNTFETQFQPNNATNMCTALMDAWARMRDLSQLDSADPITQLAPALDSESVNYIFFTDGAPTAGRFLFTADAVKPANLSSNPLTFLTSPPTVLGNYDFESYAIEWADYSTTPFTFRAGPSRLVKYNDLSSGMPRATPISINPASNPAQVSGVLCNDGLSEAPAVTATNISTVANQVFSPCLNSLEAHMPGDTSAKYGSNYDTSQWQNWREQYYNCAIELTDFLRHNNSRLFVVGLGDPASPLPAPTDPYSDINDNFHRKDIFLSRLALDPSARPAGNAVFPYTGYDDYGSWATGVDAQGVYLSTHNAADIRLLFSWIARKLLLQMTS
jgi:Flp pilus assembly protein TadG